MANEQHIHVASHDELTKLVETIERRLDEHKKEREASRAEIRQAIADMKQANDPEAQKAIMERLQKAETALAQAEADRKDLERFRAIADQYEKAQVRGERVWPGGAYGPNMPATREAKIERAYEVFGEVIHDMACIAYGREVKFGHVRAQTLASGPEGGHMVPLPILATISVLQEKFGFARRMCAFVKMIAHKMGANALGSDITISYPTENTAPATTDTKLRDPRGTLEAKMAVANCKISMQLDLDAPEGLQRFWIDRILTKVGLEEDRVLFKANNDPSPWMGVLNHPDVPEKVIASNSYMGDPNGPVAKEIVQTIHKVSQHVRGSSTLVMSEDVFGVLQGLEDTQGRPLWSPMGAAIAPVIYGRPYETHSMMPTAADDGVDKPFLAVGDWKQGALFGDRMTTSIDFDKSVHFTEAAIAMRMITDFGIYIIQPLAFARARIAP